MSSLMLLVSLVPAVTGVILFASMGLSANLLAVLGFISLGLLMLFSNLERNSLFYLLLVFIVLAVVFNLIVYFQSIY